MNESNLTWMHLAAATAIGVVVGFPLGMVAAAMLIAPSGSLGADNAATDSEAHAPVKNIVEPSTTEPPDAEVVEFDVYEKMRQCTLINSPVPDGWYVLCYHPGAKDFEWRRLPPADK